MNILEIALVVIALSAAVVGIAVGVLVRRILPLIADSGTLVRNVNRGVDRAQHILTDVESTVGGVRNLERRVSRAAHLALDQVEPGLHGTLALISGLNGVFRGLLGGGSRRRRTEDTITNRPSTRKGADHE